MRRMIVVLPVAFASLTLVPAAIAATDTVTNKNDSGPGSLRAVIAAAAPGDTVVFAPSVTGTISLTSGPISIAGDLTIQGPGASNLAVDAGGHSQILNISAGTVSITGLTLSHGQAGGAGGAAASSGSGDGGAIYDNSSGSLTVTDCTFSHNAAGGTGGAGDSSGEGIGGAISDEGGGSLTVTDSTFAANVAGGPGGAGDFSGEGFGGAINAQEFGSLAVTGSTFTNNVAGGAGGAGTSSGVGDGGAIFAQAFGQFAGLGPQLISDSTLFANRAGGAGGGGSGSGAGLGGALDASFPVTVQSSTVDGNSVGSAGGSAGSGIFDASDVSAAATIVSANTGASNCDSPVGSTSFSLEGPSSADTSCGFDLSSADPQLGPLQNNGGPTETQALPSTSPAIGRVPISACPTSVDQRGLPRPDAGEQVCDVGAYEYQLTLAPGSGQPPSLSPSVVITTPQDRATFTYGSVPDSSFECAPAAGSSLLPGLSGCSASIDGGGAVPSGTPLNGSVGVHTIVATATDTDGQSATATAIYTVRAGAPRANIIRPRDRATLFSGSLPRVSFSCDAGAGGSLAPGLSGCSASVDGGRPVASGAPLNRSVGSHTIVVTATDTDGQTATATAHYAVVRPPSTRVRATPQLVLLPRGGVGFWHVSATLTSGGKPVAHRTVVFASGQTPLCRAVTGSHGIARCRVSLSGELAVLRSGDYTAAFKGDREFRASRGRTAAISLGRARPVHTTILSAALAGHGVSIAIGARHERSSLRSLPAGAYTVTVTLSDGQVLSRQVSIR
jgi:hypothetical protein